MKVFEAYSCGDHAWIYHSQGLRKRDQRRINNAKLCTALKECICLSSLYHFLGQGRRRVGRRRREDGGHRVLVLLHELRVTPETDALLMFIALNFRSGAPEAKTSLDLIMDFVLILGKVENYCWSLAERTDILV